jgi:hypothetical protein
MGGLPAFVGRLGDEAVFELRISGRQKTRHAIKGGDRKAVPDPCFRATGDCAVRSFAGKPSTSAT